MAEIAINGIMPECMYIVVNDFQHHSNKRVKSTLGCFLFGIYDDFQIIVLGHLHVNMMMNTLCKCKASKAYSINYICSAP